MVCSPTYMRHALFPLDSPRSPEPGANSAPGGTA